MAFSDYLDLRTFVLEQSRRPDLADIFDTLTLLAENALNRRLRTRHQITETTLTFTSGAADLPADYAEVIDLYGAGGRPLAQRTYNQSERSGTGWYAIDGNQIIGPTGDLTLHYYAKLPTLTSAMTASNWLLESYPAVYLYAVSLEVAKHTRSMDEVSALSSALGQELAALYGADGSERYSRARVRVEGPTP
jgi:hypothetical protein